MRFRRSLSTVSQEKGEDSVAEMKQPEGSGSPQGPRRGRGRVAGLLAVPLVLAGGLAVAMHFSADIRHRVEEILPGATHQLSRFTTVTYDDPEVEHDRFTQQANKVVDELRRDVDKAQEVVQHVIQQARDVTVHEVERVKEFAHRSEEAIKRETAAVNERLHHAVDSLRGSRDDAKPTHPIPAQPLPSVPEADPETPVGLSRERELEIEVRRLEAELQSRTQWEAVRLQEALQAISDEEKAGRARDLAAAERHARTAFEEQLAKEREEADLRLEKLVEEQRRQIEEQKQAELQHQMAKFVEQKEADIQMELVREKDALQNEFIEKLASSRKESVEALDELVLKLSIIEKEAEVSSAISQAGEKARKVATVSFGFSDAASGSKPFMEEASILTSLLDELGPEAELSRTTLRALPPTLLETGAPTIPELQSRFSRVATACRRAALVPDNGGFWHHALATVVTALKLPESGPHVEGVSIDARIARAQYFISRGDLSSTIREIDGMPDGQAKALCEDWIKSARGRLQIDQAARVLTADAILLQELYAPES